MSDGGDQSAAEPELRESDRDYLIFAQKLEARELGHYEPGGAPTLHPPLQTLNLFPKATLLHEEVHQELTLATTFGGFLLFFVTLAEFDRNRQICERCFRHQWLVQEGAATYAGLAVVAQQGAEAFRESVDRLPARRDGQSPYREVFDYVTGFLPLVPGTGRPRLQAQVAAVVAIAHCSLDLDCYGRFGAPPELTEGKLDQYLAANSPDRRFQGILAALGKERMGRLAEELEAETRTAGEGFDPVRSTMRKVAALVARVPMVVELPEIKAQHRAFCEGWKERYREWTGDVLVLRPGHARDFVIPQLPGQLPVTAMSLAHLEGMLQQCAAEGQGLWAVIYMEAADALKLDVFPCKMDARHNPSPEPDALRKYLQHGFHSGRFRTAELIALLRRFPGFPQAITFIKWSWFFWQEGGGDTLELPGSVFVSLDRELKWESVELHLRFRNLRPGAEYFLIDYDEAQAMACLVNGRIPRVYALQYLAGDAGLVVFKGLASEFRIPSRTAPASEIAHLPLLRLMSLPAFQLGDRDAQSPLLVIMKLLRSWE